MKRVLITGVKGMAGSHLADFLVGAKHRECFTGEECHYKVFGNDLPDRPWDDNIVGNKELVYKDVDIRDRAAVHELMQEVAPDWVFHLAAEAFVPDSWERPQDVLETNVVGTANVLEAARLLAKKPIVQIACTSEEYGLVYPEETPVNPKTQPFRPMSPYGVSKVSSELLGAQYTRSYGLPTVLTRTFNHTGPRQNDQYVTSSFCKQALLVAAGRQAAVLHGDLTSVRDFTDVRDICRAYVEAVRWVEKTGVGGRVFQIGGADILSAGTLLKAVCKKTGLLFGVHTKPVRERMRPSDVPLLCCDSSEFSEMTGWQPLIGYNETIDDVLSYWREKLGLG